MGREGLPVPGHRHGFPLGGSCQSFDWEVPTILGAHGGLPCFLPWFVVWGDLGRMWAAAGVVPRPRGTASGLHRPPPAC